MKQTMCIDVGENHNAFYGESQAHPQKGQGGIGAATFGGYRGCAIMRPARNAACVLPGSGLNADTHFDLPTTFAARIDGINAMLGLQLTTDVAIASGKCLLRRTSRLEETLASMAFQKAYPSRRWIRTSALFSPPSSTWGRDRRGPFPIKQPN